jgi:hypothetical protein
LSASELVLKTTDGVVIRVGGEEHILSGTRTGDEEIHSFVSEMVLISVEQGQ